MKKSIAAIAMAALLAACGGEKKSAATEDKPTETGVDVSKNPLGAIGALGQMAKDAEKAQKEIEQMEPVDPVHFSKLIEALPDVPSGWTAEDAQGETSTMGDVKISQATRVYSKEGGGQVRVEVRDWAFNKGLYLPFLMAANFSQETTEGYNKGIKMGEDPGREEYNHKSKRGNRQMVLNKRYNVAVHIDDLPVEAINEWWGKLKLSGLPVK